MVFTSPGDVITTINGFPVYYYGLIMALACLTGVFVSYKLFKHCNPLLKYENIWDFAAYLLIFGFIGARLYYCFMNPVYYMNNPLEILNFREGGLSIHGGLIGGAIALIVLAKKYQLPTKCTLDAFACGTAVAQSIGRWGNFFNSEAFGTPTDLPWKLFIPLSKRPAQYADFDYFHPAFLYESILDFLIFIVLLFVINKFHKDLPGLTFCIYLVLYSIARLVVENIRTDCVLDISGVSVAIFASIILLLIGITIGSLIIKKHFKQN